MINKSTSIILIFILVFFSTGCTHVFKKLPVMKHKGNYGKHTYMSNDVLPSPPELEPNEISVGKAISILKKGQKAPFTGILISPEATAGLIIRLETFDKECQIKIDKELSTQKIKSDLKYEQLKITYENYINNCQVKISSRDDTIKLLNKALEKNTNPKTELWFIGGVAGGFVLGAAITIATVYATSNAFK